jgi:hypothetical protein
MVKKKKQSLSNNQKNKQYNLPYVKCIISDIFFLIHNLSIYLDFEDRLGFLVTRILGDGSKPFKF